MDPIIALSHELIEKGSKSFAMAAKLLPRDTRYDAMMLYAWCRHCDDVIDDQILGFNRETGSEKSPQERLEGLRRDTSAALAGTASEPVFVALGRVAHKHHIPERHPMELLRGFEMDVNERVYETLEDTLDYCYHVAGVVGVMMAMIMGVRERPTLNRASDLGIAFQLTNICRDVVEDAKGGRLYLPRQWLREAGVPEDKVADPQYRGQVYEVTKRLLCEADEYYRSALFGMQRLPLGAAVGIGAARRVYRDIGRLVANRGESAWDGRAIVGPMRKLAAALSGATAAVRAHTTLRIGYAPPRDGLFTVPELGKPTQRNRPFAFLR
ncbi:phytoene/squalene synthase family protein [Rhodomicrobium lacus]|uniref:phytoene/squalene synthase family protein n=1 Tax=Rhodomicrobium lacus TaxID=2498452 RepID=UPI000F8CF390|nr:phytoene/squalene synthase family protein [Rhodomicrobium lacus]